MRKTKLRLFFYMFQIIAVILIFFGNGKYSMDKCVHGHTVFPWTAFFPWKITDVPWKYAFFHGKRHTFHLITLKLMKITEPNSQFLFYNLNPI